MHQNREWIKIHMTRICLPRLSYHSKCCNFGLEFFNHLWQNLIRRAGPVFRHDQEICFSLIKVFRQQKTTYFPVISKNWPGPAGAYKLCYRWLKRLQTKIAALAMITQQRQTVWEACGFRLIDGFYASISIQKNLKGSLQPKLKGASVWLFNAYSKVATCH